MLHRENGKEDPFSDVLNDRINNIDDDIISETIIKYFHLLGETIESTQEISPPQILSSLKVIYDGISQNHIAIHGPDKFIILIYLFTHYSEEIHIFVLSIIEEMLKYSDEAPYEYIKSGFTPLLFEILQNSDNLSIKIKIFYIMFYIIPCENDDILFQFCLDNHFIDILLNEYAVQLQVLLANPVDRTAEDILYPVLSSLLTFFKFPELIESDLYGLIFRISSDILEKRNDHQCFDLLVKDVILSANDLVGKVDFVVFIESGFIHELISMIHEEILNPQLHSKCFYLLGHLIFAYPEKKGEIATNVDLLSLCHKAMEINDGTSFTADDNEYLEAFFFFLTNLHDLMDLRVLYEKQFYHWCIHISQLTSYKSQKSICYFLISVLSSANPEVLLSIFMINDFAPFIFDFLKVAKPKLLAESFCCFQRIMTIIPDFTERFPQFITELFSLIEQAEQMETDEIETLAQNLKKLLESSIDC